MYKDCYEHVLSASSFTRVGLYAPSIYPFRRNTSEPENEWHTQQVLNI